MTPFDVELPASDALSPGRNSAVPTVTYDPVALLLADKRSAETKRAYAADIVRFFVYVGAEPTPDVVR